MDERIQELEAQRKELERQRKQNRDELRLAKSKQKKPMSYYIKNTLIILGILGYLYIMYGPYDLKQKLALWVKPKNVDPKNFQNVVEAGGLLLLGYILRVLDQQIIGFLKDTICLCFCHQKFNTSDLKDQLLGSGIATYGSSSSSSDNDNDIEPEILTASIIYEKRTTWEQARCKLMHTKCQAYAISIFRLICIHWFQPIFYWIIFIAYQDNLDENQLVYGYIVGIREIIYIMLTLVCLNVNRAYLLVDVVGTWNESKLDFITYVFAPEKFIYLCLDMKKIDVGGIDLFLFILIVFDWFGICALVAAIENGITPPLLMIGYTVTTIGGILYGSLILFEKLSKLCRQKTMAYNSGITMREIDGMVKGIYTIPEEIVMDGQGITDADCVLFSRLLKKNNTVTTLWLSNNKITDVQCR